MYVSPNQPPSPVESYYHLLDAAEQKAYRQLVSGIQESP